MKYLEKIIDWIKKEVKKANAKGVVVGISGGIDSALVAYLAKKSFPNNSLGVLMPINKQRKYDLDDGIELAKKFNLDYEIIDLYNEFEAMSNKIKIKSKLTKGNLQARLRMSTLYSFAQENNYLVLGTDNKAEYFLGYFTKWGDGGCDLLPIVHLYKSQVFEYSRKIGVPKSILEKKPSAGLWDGQNDEQELGFTYNDFEKYDKGENISLDIKKKIIEQMKKTEHKRKSIPQPPKPIINKILNDNCSKEIRAKNPEDWIKEIKEPLKIKRIKNIDQFIKKNFKNLNTTIKWNQLIYMNNNTFILGISIMKNHIDLAPELKTINVFKDEIQKVGYEHTKLLFKIKDEQEINFELINKIIKFNIEDKKNIKTFWRPKDEKSTCN